MTRRTESPPSVDEYARAYVDAAFEIVRREVPNLTAARLLRLDLVIGAGWELRRLDEPAALLAKRDISSAALAEAARDLTRAVVSRLDIAGKSWLAERMHESRDEQLPGAEPPHFRITIDFEAESSWQLRVSAYARGGACTVAELAGAIEPAHQAAA